MGRPPKRTLLAAVESTISPPDRLADGHVLGRVVKAEGSNLYLCALPGDSSDSSNKSPVLVELDPKFRNAVWLRRGGFVLVNLVGDDKSAPGRPAGSRVAGDIVNVVRDEKAWRKMPYWPKEFARSPAGYEDDENDLEQSTVGKMPPSESEDEEDEASREAEQT